MPVAARENPRVWQTGAQGKQVALSWEKPEQAGQDVWYKIYYRYAVQNSYHLLKETATPAARPEVSVRLPKAGRKYQIKIVPYSQDRVIGQAYILKNCVTPPGKISLCSQKSYATSQSMKIYWKDAESASGYEFLVKNLSGGTGKRYRTDKRSSTTLAGIQAGRFYQVRIRGYVRVNGRNVYGTPSYTYIAQQPRVKFKWGSRSAVLASWPKVEGAADYAVYLSSQPSGGFRKVETTAETLAAIPGLSRNRRYYVYVAARMRKGKTVYTSPRTHRYTFSLQAE